MRKLRLQDSVVKVSQLWSCRFPGFWVLSSRPNLYAGPSSGNNINCVFSSSSLFSSIVFHKLLVDWDTQEIFPNSDTPFQIYIWIPQLHKVLFQNIILQ